MPGRRPEFSLLTPLDEEPAAMRASLIIAGHNEGARLARTVEACQASSNHLDCEIVVADDASTDGSVDELVCEHPQIRVYRHASRQGASPTKALGGQQARGQTLVFLDGHTN